MIFFVVMTAEFRPERTRTYASGADATAALLTGAAATYAFVQCTAQHADDVRWATSDGSGRDCRAVVAARSKGAAAVVQVRRCAMWAEVGGGDNWKYFCWAVEGAAFIVQLNANWWWWWYGRHFRFVRAKLACRISCPITKRH